MKNAFLSEMDEAGFLLTVGKEHIYVERSQIVSAKTIRIPSLFDEIGIIMTINYSSSEKNFTITERDKGFFEVAYFLGFKDKYGSTWYYDTENGDELEISGFQ